MPRGEFSGLRTRNCSNRSLCRRHRIRCHASPESRIRSFSKWLIRHLIRCLRCRGEFSGWSLSCTTEFQASRRHQKLLILLVMFRISAHFRSLISSHKSMRMPANRYPLAISLASIYIHRDLIKALAFHDSQGVARLNRLTCLKGIQQID